MCAAGRFQNENPLHILAVNGRQQAFASLVTLASSTLSDEALHSLLFTQADGERIPA